MACPNFSLEEQRLDDLADARLHGRSRFRGGAGARRHGPNLDRQPDGKRCRLDPFCRCRQIGHPAILILLVPVAPRRSSPLFLTRTCLTVAKMRHFW